MEIGELLPIWSIIPFVGMLLSIAIFPLVKGEWWESHQLHVAAFWSLLFLIPFTIAFGFHETGYELIEVLVLDYIPFIVLLWGLFAVTGGIHIGGSFAGSTKNNVIMLAIGTFLASFIGTTGAAILMIRPVLRANQWRKYKTHVVVFFIFLIANIGGCLTPLGDPPLFLGFLRGVPFFWTLTAIWPLLVLNTILLLGLYVIVDRRYIKKEGKEGREALDLMKAASKNTKIHIDGAHNILFLLLIMVGVILNGAIPQMDMFLDANGEVFGFTVMGDIHIGFQYFVQIIIIGLAGFLSLKTTPKDSIARKEFNWDPIKEVARLFIGIFITMIPALALLSANGASIGLDTPLKFFWCTGALSGFLDNSPTYVVFLTAAGALGAAGEGAIVTTVGTVAAKMLLAISAGAVFFGGLTYVGNAPNFMVKNIAEQNRVKMPSFFGYMGWSCAILIPVFLIDTVVFFL